MRTAPRLTGEWAPLVSAVSPWQVVAELRDPEDFEEEEGEGEGGGSVDLGMGSTLLVAGGTQQLQRMSGSSAQPSTSQVTCWLARGSRPTIYHWLLLSTAYQPQDGSWIPACMRAAASIVLTIGYTACCCEGCCTHNALHGVPDACLTCTMELVQDCSPPFGLVWAVLKSAPFTWA
jgi:hypothetical protein